VPASPDMHASKGGRDGDLRFRQEEKGKSMA
jgi:hypothetical protein